MAEAQVPPGQRGPEPGSIARRAFSSEVEDPAEAALRDLVEEQYGAGAADRVGSQVATAPKPRGLRFGQIIDKLKGPDLAGVGEAIDQNKIGRFLKGSAESYLNKFDPRGKDAKAWALGMASGAASVVVAAEFGTAMATVGIAPVLRGFIMAGVLQSSNLIYEGLHRGFLWGKTRGLEQAANLRKDVIQFEKDLAKQKLSKDEVKTRYESDEFKGIILKHIAPGFTGWGELESHPSYKSDAEAILGKLTKLGQDYAAVNSAARSLAAGLAAGSMVAALGEAGVRALGGRIAGQALGTLGENVGQLPQVELPKVELPEIKIPSAPAEAPPVAGPQVAPATPGVVLPGSTDEYAIPPAEAQPPAPAPAAAPEAAPPPPPATPEAPPAPQPKLPEAVQEKIAEIQNSPEYQIEVAAEVGKYLPSRDQIVEQALQGQNILPAEVDTASFEAGKEAALGVMEGKGNEIFETAARAVLETNPNADLSQVTEVAQKAYADWLTSEAAQTQIAEAAQNAIADRLQIENALAQKITNGLATHGDWFKDVPLERGATAGKLLDLTWTAADAPVMGANIAANYDTLTDLWGNMAKVHPDLLANGSFPVSLSEINDLVARAEAGDPEAIKKLRQTLHWIPAGSKFKAIVAGVSKEVLALLK